MTIPKLTKEQAIIITGFTGILAAHKFSDFTDDVEKRMCRPIWSHEYGDKTTAEEIKELYREDFLKLIPDAD